MRICLPLLRFSIESAHVDGIVSAVKLRVSIVKKGGHLVVPALSLGGPL